ncbi:1-phosphofructokinase family hexose kinase [Curtobacterium flaccumfaciens]|uniref:1-phosphofructokinase family hexose kinase n=1 Tax=Curtobacterium flaccumfaciens TaxID=2035 RepID=UPI000FFF0AD7|nr:hexose kinase [Curtobacterium flaccumfaciens]MCS0645271.1 hexose kinase [Curtobacterium flaccumfaciens pv. flaccumfaciens]MCS6527285.1 hexose kinase [Curtobacterium flaccumfaciens pv. flaccumfaciens]MCS6531027.1 hexose kinase [Curtobacterium flaccumfaciens pv. flaccumfaciens]NUU09504.1 hexose kinase [Curtobacterium flaccumfaciens]RXF82931.1 1-phosphofructokinase [Curtobacterium flaccumfaciens pv. flaccumfaciens]
MNARIVTVTPNPSLDRTIELAGELQRGAVQRATRSTAEPGGKGVNVSRVVVASGGDTVAVLPGDELDPVLLGLATRGIPTAALPIGAPLRSNVTVTEPTGTTTKLNEPGPSLAGRLDDLAALVADTAAATATGPAARWVVVAGSLPPGLPDDALAVLVRAVRARHGADVRIAVDSSGVPFTALLQSGERIDLVKPNAEELAEVVGGDPEEYERDLDAAVAGAQRLRRKNVGTVLLTLGSAGAVLVSDEGAFAAAAPKIVARSTVGAGDSSLAGYLLAEVAGASPAQRLAQAVATGAAAAALPGSDVPALDHTDPTAVSVRVLDTHPAPEPA